MITKSNFRDGEHGGDAFMRYYNSNIANKEEVSVYKLRQQLLNYCGLIQRLWCGLWMN